MFLLFGHLSYATSVLKGEKKKTSFNLQWTREGVAAFYFSFSYICSPCVDSMGSFGGFIELKTRGLKWWKSFYLVCFRVKQIHKCRTDE